MTSTLGIIVTIVVGLVILAAVFVLGRKAEKAEPPADRSVTAAEVKRLEEAETDWGSRADFWIAEFDRAVKEQDLLAEEVARESIEFLLDTRPQPVPKIPSRSEVRRAAVRIDAPSSAAVPSVPREKPAPRMTEVDSYALQQEALQRYESGDIGWRAFDYLRKARELGLSIQEACVQLDEEVVLTRRARAEKETQQPAQLPWGGGLCTVCHQFIPDDELIHRFGPRDACEKCWKEATS